MDTTSCYDQHVTSNGDGYDFCRTHGAPSDYLEQATTTSGEKVCHHVHCWLVVDASYFGSSYVLTLCDSVFICLQGRCNPTGHARAVAQAWPPGRSQPTGRMIINGCIPCLLLGRQFKSRTGKTLTNTAGFTTRGRWFVCAREVLADQLFLFNCLQHRH
jgi:hypothetical protein